MTQGTEEQRLLSRLRGGSDDAFGELFEQHAPAVRRLARSLAADRSEAEDITAETFFRVLRAIKRGNGPNENVRGYLLTVARRVSWEWQGASHDVPVTDDELTSRAGVSEFNTARVAERSLIATAFSTLPERWRTVLWQTEVEGAQPAVVAPKFGLSPNATAALARRARQGLRAAYLQAHLTTTAGDRGCRSVLDKLGGYAAGSVTGAEAHRISAHLGTCPRCRSTHDELQDVCYSLRAHSGAIALAVPAVSGVGVAASAGTASHAGFTGVVKSAFGGAMVKVGAVVASTAVIGVLGVAAAPIFDRSDTDAFGLSGQQGIGETTIERAAEPDQGTAKESATGESSRTKRSEAKDKAKAGTTDAVQQADDPVDSPDTSSRPSDRVRSQLPADAPNADQGDVSSSADRARDSVTPDGTSDTAARREPTTSTDGSTAPSTDVVSDETTGTTGSTGTGTAPTDTTSDGTKSDPTAADACPPDDYQYTETYNAKRKRTEIYEYSYSDGVGYERVEYQYDNGKVESSQTWWWDNCG